MKKRSETLTKKTKSKRMLTLVICVILLLASGIILGKTVVEDKVMHHLYPIEYQALVEQNAAEHKVDSFLIYAVIRTESSFRPDATSHANAMGLMQVTPDTFDFILTKSGLGKKEHETAYDPATNIYCGTWFLSYLMNKFENNLDVSLAAYNAGVGNVLKWLQNPEYSEDGVHLIKIPFAETENYVKKVTSAYTNYQKLYK